MSTGQRLSGAVVALLLILAGLSNAAAQTSAPTAEQLAASHGSLVAGDVTFDNFQLPGQLQLPVGAVGFVGGANDIAVSTAVNGDGSASLTFTAIDPATGNPTPFVIGNGGAAEVIRLIRYNVTVTNPALRLHSVDQAFGPGTSIAPAANSAALNFLLDVQSVQNATDLLINDQLLLTGLSRALSFSSTGISNSGSSLFPGGNMSGIRLENEFGLVAGHGGIFTSAAMDSITMTFSLAPVGTPAPPADVNLNSFDVSTPGLGLIDLGTTFAQEGGAAVTLTTSNPTALPLPAAVSVPQGARLFNFPVGPANVEVPTPVTASATLNGVTLTQSVTVQPAVPLTIVGLSGNINGPQALLNPNTIQLLVSMNRTNLSPAVITLTSSNSAAAQVPASLTIPALTVPGDFRVATVSIPIQPVAVDTPVTISGSFNGVTVSQTFILLKMSDFVKIDKAEFVVRNGSLKVDATSSAPTAVLMLFNASTGQLIGTMTNNGPSKGGTKYSFQGSVSPVTTLLLKSSLNGTSTGTVTQK
jgi:hypothetical protein